MDSNHDRLRFPRAIGDGTSFRKWVIKIPSPQPLSHGAGEGLNAVVLPQFVANTRLRHLARV